MSFDGDKRKRKDAIMLKLCLDELSRREWETAGVAVPSFSVERMREKTKKEPKWIHFGAGNIFRAFPCAVLQEMLEKGAEDSGVIVAEGFDREIIEKIYRPHDDLSLLVTLKSDGTAEKKIIASVAESLTMERNENFARLQEIFQSPSLQLASFTITEKGYWLRDGEGKWFAQVETDFAGGPACCESYMGKITALCYTRYLAGELPLSLVSMDNFSHNGDKLQEAVLTFAREWEERGLVKAGFLAYLQCPRIAFPWTMIDKITPRPDQKVEEMLQDCGIEGMTPVVTGRHTYIAPFVNAEACQYLVIEDRFPAGRPDFEQGGLILTDRETVDKTERMKVCTCLNPLHTALAVFGCLLGFTRICDEMQDPVLRKLVTDLGNQEGLPVVVDPGILDPRQFLNEVLQQRLPNPFLPDSPQRIATDTSQKLAIRFGETIKSWIEQGREPDQLRLIPLIFAGWCRYLMGIDDQGEPFSVSPDPLYQEVYLHIENIRLGDTGSFSAELSPILRNTRIFGLDLYEAGLGQRTEALFAELVAEKGAVRKTLEKYTGMQEEK